MCVPLAMLDYDALEAEATQANLIALRKRLDKGKIDQGLNTKIENFARRYGLEPELIRYKLLHDDLFLLSFIKAPGRQSLHQNKAFEYLRQLPGVHNALLLRSAGPGAKFLVHGAVMDYEQCKDISALPKSIDFEWKTQRSDGSWVSCYATHKFTREGGGSQDNQFHDVQSFMKHAETCMADHLFFFAICDGAYYQMPFQHERTRIDYLNGQLARKRSKAVTINTLVNEFMVI